MNYEEKDLPRKALPTARSFDATKRRRKLEDVSFSPFDPSKKDRRLHSIAHGFTRCSKNSKRTTQRR